MQLEHNRIKRGKHKEDIYHIQHINSLHSSLKRCMNRFYGVTTKYLGNYMKFFKRNLRIEHQFWFNMFIVMELYTDIGV